MRKIVWGVGVLVFILSSAGLAAAEPLRVASALPALKGFTAYGSCVAKMGTHYARKGEWPLGPILGYDEKGRLVFVEYMVTQQDFTSGLSWENLPGVAGKTVDHIDITFMPEGHPGHQVPHYDIHLYFVGPTEKAQICPDGETGKTGERVVRYMRK